ncbi:MAG: hypothetical protein ACTSW1_15945 [Candidatus Hodarchaeales archaeon]
MKHFQKTLFIIIISFTWIFTSHASVTQGNDQKILFITENVADNQLAMTIVQKGNFSYDIIDIKPMDDLNVILEQDHMTNYQAIFLILNQISTPFDNTKISSISDFINSGNVFGLVSTQIWRFPSTFHDLLALDPTQMGQKEYPNGNESTSISYTITNDTLLQTPFQFLNDTSIDLQLAIGLSDSLNPSFRIARSEETPNGHADINAFSRKKGFVIAAPVSPVTVSSSLSTLGEFFTSILYAGLDFIYSNTSVDTTQDSLSTTTGLNLVGPKLEISGDIITFGATIAGLGLILAGLAYFMTKIISSAKPSFDVPKDKSLLSSLILGPILFIGQILYPPILRRISDYDVLSNEYRSRIVELLQEKDFLHFRELKRELGIGTSSLRWHLQVLEDFRIISRSVFGQYEIYYLLQKPPDPDFVQLYFAIISGGGYAVAKAFNELNIWDLSHLAEYLGQSENAIRYHIRKFQKLNFLTIKEQKYIFNPKKLELLKEALKRRRKTN